MLYPKLKKIVDLLNEGKIIEGTNGAFKIDGIHLTKKDVNILSRESLLTRVPTTEKYSVYLKGSDICKNVVFEQLKKKKVACKTRTLK